jgi:hypothetical protein
MHGDMDSNSECDLPGIFTNGIMDVGNLDIDKFRICVTHQQHGYYHWGPVPVVIMTSSLKLLKQDDKLVMNLKGQACASIFSTCCYARAVTTSGASA